MADATAQKTPQHEFIKSVHGVRYQVKDVARSVTFYTQQLGFTLKHQQLPAFANVSLGDSDILLSGPGASGSRPMPNGEQQQPGGWNRVVLRAADLPALLANPDAIELPLSQIENGGVFVAEVAGAVLGFAAILQREDGDSELDGLFVEPHAWRQGIGKILVNHCCDAARSAGAASIHVVGNPHAESFYGACGFTAAGTKQMRFGVGLLLKREL